MLRKWKTFGWSAEFGREPAPDDLIVPDLDLKHRTNKQTRTRLYAAFKALRLRHRRFHDGRRTFTSLLRERDVPRQKVEWIKDGPQKDLLGRYTTFSWSGLRSATQS
jgi:integrase